MLIVVRYSYTASCLLNQFNTAVSGEGFIISEMILVSIMIIAKDPTARVAPWVVVPMLRRWPGQNTLGINPLFVPEQQ